MIMIEKNQVKVVILKKYVVFMMFLLPGSGQKYIAVFLMLLQYDQ